MSESTESREETNPLLTVAWAEAVRRACLGPERRLALLQSVAAWLDELIYAEPPPPAGSRDDAGSRSGARPVLTAGPARRADARDAAPGPRHQSPARRAGRGPGAVWRRASAVRSAIAKKLGEARREARLRVVAELLEARSLRARARGKARRRLAGLSGLRARFGQRPVLEALVEGNGLALDRLDNALKAARRPRDCRAGRAVRSAADARGGDPRTRPRGPYGGRVVPHGIHRRWHGALIRRGQGRRQSGGGDGRIPG